MHAFAALLLSTGIVMPLLGILDRSFPDVRLLLLCAAIVILFEVISLHRISCLIAASVLIAGTVIWAFSYNGAATISDLLIAISLRFRGTETALPIIADSVKIIVTCFITLICCFLCLRKSTALPAVVLTLAASLLIWLTDRREMIPWLLPALTALLLLMMTSRYPETSRLRVLPWSVLIVVAAFLLAGNGVTISGMKNKADEFRQNVMDRLFFTEARDVFSLYSVGFSPQGPDQLGGKPTPDNVPIMQVTSSRTVYLRGSIYDEYTGHGWRNTAAGRRYLWQSDRMSSERALIFNEDLPSSDVQTTLSNTETIYIHMLNDSTSTLFVPQRIRELFPGRNMVPYFSNSSEVFITRNLHAGDTYSVSASLFSSEETGIRTLTEMCSMADDPQWDNISFIYTSLPSHLEQNVFDLSRKITAGAATPYDRAMSILNYLIQNYCYTLDVAEHPENRDFVTEFLMNTKQGYCTYFASAMTVLCRMAGLPARYVEGYRAVPDVSGEAVVTGMDAHAWTEVYFKGFGWLVFDPAPGNGSHENGEHGSDSSGPEAEPESSPEPTPGPTPTPEPTPSPTPEPTPSASPESEPSETPHLSSEGKSPEPTSTPTPTPVSQSSSSEPPAVNNHPSPGQDQEESATGQRSPFFPWLLIPLILIAAFGIRMAMTSPSFREHKAHSEEKKTDIWIQEVSDLLNAENLSRKKGETPLGYAERIDRSGFFSCTIRPVGEMISLLVYSKVIPEPSDTSLIRDTAVTLRKEISKPARFRYWAGRIFIPLKRRNWKTR